VRFQSSLIFIFNDALLQFTIFNPQNFFYFLIFFGVFIFFEEESDFVSYLEFFSKELIQFIFVCVEDNLLYFTKAYTHFFFFLCNSLLFINITGLTLYSFSSTSYLAVTLILSLMINYVAYKLTIIFGKITFFENFLPFGSPRNIAFLLIFIEVLAWTSRIISLAVRLFANITAGHILLKILSVFSIIFLFSFNIYFFLFIIPNLVIAILYVMETFVGLLQAYVFFILVVIYFTNAIEAH
jgi:ATP synthase subunit 6